MLTMKTNKLHRVSLILFSIIVWNGCYFGNNQNQNKNSAEQTICSEDSLFSVAIPKGWVQITDYSLNDEADIQAQKTIGSQYFVALIESKDDLDYTFEEWNTKVREAYVSSFSNLNISEGKDVLIGGYPAKQYEISGTIERIKITILATYINGENHFAQIYAWTLTSRYKSSVDDLKAITHSIKGL